MTFLPIVARELRVASRRPATFRLRIFVAVLTGLIGAGMLLMGDAGAAARSGKGVFSSLGFLAFLFCLLDGARHAADSVSEEKREGTLGLLFLTDLRGYDVVLGKMVATSVKSFQGLFAFLPILSIALVLGGVTGGEFWRTALVLANTLFWSSSLGMWVSSMSRESHRALSATLGGVALITGLPMLIHVWTRPWAPSFSNIVACFSPGFSATLIPSGSYASNAGGFWLSLAVTHALSWGALILASLITPRSWQDQPALGSDTAKGERRYRWRFGDAARRTQLRQRLLGINPLFWLAARDDRERWMIWALLTAIGAILVVVFLTFLSTNLQAAMAVVSVTMMLVTLVLKVWVASLASYPFAEARRNGTMEIILATPLTTEEFLHGHWRALERFFLWPALVVIFVKLAAVAVQLFFGNPAQGGWLLWLPSAGGATYEAVKVALDLIAVAWLGMLMGMTQKSPFHALTRTLFFGVLIPFLLFCIPNVLIDLVIIQIARPRLRRDLRRLASERAAPEAQPEEQRRIRPTPPLATVPPVIERRQ
ncbi:MAG: ABC transporter permease subunit [Verrucomicrobia bacterium]|nr:ABC transporter permease subunit [Verrucomicrobiota bacterium]